MSFIITKLMGITVPCKPFSTVKCHRYTSLSWVLCFQLHNRCFILYKKKSLIWMGHMQEYNSMLCDWILTLRIQWGVWQCFKPWGFSNSLSSSFIWLADFFFSYKFYCSNMTLWLKLYVWSVMFLFQFWIALTLYIFSNNTYSSK